MKNKTHYNVSRKILSQNCRMSQTHYPSTHIHDPSTHIHDPNTHIHGRLLKETHSIEVTFLLDSVVYDFNLNILFVSVLSLRISVLILSVISFPN